MKNAFAHLLCYTGLSLFSVTGNAQSIALKVPENPIVIDGDKKEWRDDLIYNPETNTYYALASDKQNLYLLIKTNDLMQQNSILQSGLTISVDTKGRKKAEYSVTFPVKSSVAVNGNFNTLEGKREIANLTKSKKIGTKGFKDVTEDQLNTDNAYKIQTALNFDDDGYLIYEEAIPMALFHADPLANNEWSYNIKFNAVIVSTPPTGQSSAGRGIITSAVVAVKGSDLQQTMRDISTRSNVLSNAGAQSQIEISKAIDFWGKFKLAQ